MAFATSLIATKEFFVPAIGIAVGATREVYGDYPVIRLDVKGEKAVIPLRIPHDFSLIINAEIIVIPRATSAVADWPIESSYAATGESHATHGEIDNITNYDVTNGEFMLLIYQAFCRL